jgi:murein L,D-transpeptidase YcbB/YkuD
MADRDTIIMAGKSQSRTGHTGGPTLQRNARAGLWLGVAALMLPAAALAAPRAQSDSSGSTRTPPPQQILPASMQRTPAPAATPQANPTPQTTPPTIEAQPVVPGTAQTKTVTTIVPAEQPVRQWTLTDAQALLVAIKGIDAEGLYPADYKPVDLAAAIAGGPGIALDEAASRSFDWLAEDLRDGRTPMDSRIQWFAVDTDVDANPTHDLIDRALQNHDVPGVLASLTPKYQDYAALKAALAATPRADRATRDLIRINMERWRWLPRDMGNVYLITNVPEFQLRFTVGGKILRTYKTVVGKPGRTATPQLAEHIEAVVFNPTWTVPQSIIKNEGLGEKLMAHPRPGYKVTRSANGVYSVVQEPGDNNSLGRMKIDMPNSQAIYLHDTPAKALFNTQMRAYSHGCIRTENALKLGMTIAQLRGDITPEEGNELFHSLKYKRVVLKQSIPVYITYTTMGLNVDGQMTTYKDIYGRDTAVLASMHAPRILHTTQRTSTQEVIVAQDPL